MESIPSPDAAPIQPFAVRESTAMQLVGLKRTVFKDLVASGDIPSFKVGGARLYAVNELKAWVESRATATAIAADGPTARQVA